MRCGLSFAMITPELNPEIAESWAAEIRRRLDEIRRGGLVGVPTDQAFAKGPRPVASFLKAPVELDLKHGRRSETT